MAKSDFILKLAIKSETLNSKTSLINEKESFIIPTADKFRRNDNIPSSSALWILASPYRTDYLLQCNCAINFDDSSILARNCNKFKLLPRESLLKKRDKPTLNTKIKLLPYELFCYDGSFISNTVRFHFNI